MAGMDSVLAAALARRLDSLLGLSQGASNTGTPSAVAATAPVGAATSTHAELTTQTSSAAIGTSTTPANVAPYAPPPGQQTTLSAAARTIDTILRLAPDNPGAVKSATPIWPVPPGQGAPALAPLLAGALKDALATSGLFYEAHLSQWAAGSRAFEQLQLEPQLRWPAEANLAARLLAAGGDATLPLVDSAANLSPAPPATPEGDAAGARPAPWLAADGDSAASGGLHTSANLPNTATALAHAASLSQAVTSVLPGHAAAGPAYAPGLGSEGANMNAAGLPQHAAAAMTAAVNVPPESVTMLRQQLEMLVNPQFQWSGQAWPGAALEWQVEERPARTGAEAFAPASTWHTHLRLTLPTLGTVDVTLGLSGQQLQAKLLTDAPATLAQLSSGSEDLRQRFASAGLIASQLTFGAIDDTPLAGLRGSDIPGTATGAGSAVPQASASPEGDVA
ncbi:hypothetical protein PTE30175_04397 [Pandoraea terrae]|uniref:Flagellar hook-length control protein-like C-terminal domain-containing protein n=1 Tax=Pandoraea terrae TaxID=1537710 RepID=A0A5E4YG43_9BURK|nr:flagellar hook-length control protein FliK [Pandoraea terrae]VVE47694.1 hypothetical protein PTE30175_04397 [Pandoraea terrae]